MRRARLAAMLSLVVAAAAAAAAPTAAVDEAMDEVVVSGARLGDLRAEVVRLEDQFYQRYNQLNRDHQFDIRCQDEAPTGSRLLRRVCRPVFISQADETHGSGFVAMIQATSGGAAVGASPAAEAIVATRYKDFQSNVATVTRANRELARLLERRTTAQARYDAARRKVLGLKPAAVTAPPG